MKYYGNVSYVSSFTVMWKNNYYQYYSGTGMLNWKSCSENKIHVNHYKCLHFSHANIPASKRDHYLAFHNKTKSKTWNEASALCKSIGGYLPYFHSEKELEDLLASLKLSQDIPAIEGLFIGLKYNINKVS